MPDSAETPPGRAERRAEQARAFDHIGARYDEAFPHKDGQVEATTKLAADLPPGSRVLDIGCGTGLPTARMLCDGGFAVMGVDTSPVMLELARANVLEAEFHHLDVLDLDLSLGPFDAAVAFFSLLMLPRAEIGPALRRVSGLLRPGGALLLAMVEADLDDVPIPFLGATIRVSGYLRTDLVHVLETNGFAVDDLHDRTYAPVGPGAPPEVQLFVTAHQMATGKLRS
ncbi:MAG: class I SAM-dependent DNA methyltransferase [Actinopolymorphaceae bacterium]